MGLYQLYFLTPTGRLLRRTEISADGDADALSRVEPSDDPATVELWQGGRLVRRWRNGVAEGGQPPDF